jgi:hypothetical protein
VPPSSPAAAEPPEILESDADDSDDDYGKEQMLKQRAREKLAARGKPLPPRSEDEDAEDEEEFEFEIEENGLGDVDEKQRRTKKTSGKSNSAANSKRKTETKSDSKGQKKGKGTQRGEVGPDERAGGEAKRKGKGKEKEKRKRKGKGKKALSSATPDDDADNDGDEEGDELGGGHKSGPLPAAIRERAQGLFDKFSQDMEALAAECGKPASTLHQAVGSALRAPRATSPWNMWQQWYAVEHPKTSESKQSGDFLSLKY